MRQSLSDALTVFVASRGLVLFLLVLGSQLTFVPEHTHDGLDVHNPSIELSSEGVVTSLKRIWLSGDGFWYLELAKNGYSRAPADTASMQNWVFFPLLPILIKTLGTLLGSNLIAGLIIANLYLFLFLVALSQLAQAFELTPRQSSFALWCAAFFPLSYFFSSPLTESLFAALTTLSVLMLLRNRILLSAVLMAVASAARPTGLLLLPGYALLLFQRTDCSIYRKMVALPLCGVGAVAYMGYLYLICGDPFAFSHNQQFWDRGKQSVWELLLQLGSHPGTAMVGWNFVWLNAFIGAIALAIAARLMFLRQFGLALMLLVPVCAALSTGTVLSLGRFVMALFPVYLVLGRDVNDERLQRGILCLFASLLAVMTVMYAAHVTAAMA